MGSWVAGVESAMLHGDGLSVSHRTVVRTLSMLRAAPGSLLNRGEAAEEWNGKMVY